MSDILELFKNEPDLKKINQETFKKDDIFGLMIPENLKGVDMEILNPINAWIDKEKFKIESKKLSNLFKENFIKYGENSKKFSEKFHWNKVVKNYLELIN